MSLKLFYPFFSLALFFGPVLRPRSSARWPGGDVGGGGKNEGDAIIDVWKEPSGTSPDVPVVGLKMASVLNCQGKRENLQKFLTIFESVQYNF